MKSLDLTYIFIYLAVIKSLKLLLQKQFHIKWCFMVKRRYALTCEWFYFAFHEKYSKKGHEIFSIGKTVGF